MPPWKEKGLPENLKEFTLAELAEYHGAEGRRAYIAFKGRVYDVSDSALWAGGEHMVVHLAGRDLTGEFAEAPHGEEVFQRYPQVGVLREETGEEEISRTPKPGFWDRLFKRFPVLKRHPHPMVVHFPIVFFVSSPIFAVLFLLTGEGSFETTGWHCLGGGVLFTPVALVTGLLTWWRNYELRPLRPIIIKLVLTPLLLAVGAGAFIWRWLAPDILLSLNHWTGKVYLALVCSTFPLVSLIGWYGATLTFPLHEEAEGQ